MPRWLLLPLSTLLALATTWPLVAAPPAPDDDEPVDPTRPGLVAMWSDGTHSTGSLESRLAWRLADGESPQPGLLALGYQAHVRGVLHVARPGKYTFSAIAAGDLELSLNGTLVISTGKPDFRAEPIRLPYGPTRLEARFRPATSGRGELQVFWQREGEFRETIVADALRHLPADESPEWQRSRRAEQGRRLFVEYRCGQCHQNGPGLPPDVGLPVDRAPSLKEIAGRVRVSWLSHWLDRPHAFRATTTMPDLFADTPGDRVDRYAAVQYLGSLGTVPAEAPFTPDAERAKIGARAFATVGCIACHTAPGERDEKHPELIPLDGLASKLSAAEIRRRIVEPRAAHPDSRMPDFRLADEQPAALEGLVHFLASSQHAAFAAVVPPPEKKSAAEWQALGRKVVEQRGCLSCHDVGTNDRPAPAAPRFAQLMLPAGGVAGAGCLAEAPKIGVPDFQASSHARACLAEFLGSFQPPPAKLQRAPLFAAELQMDRLGCTACHARNGRGGAFADRITKFVTLGTDQTVRDLAPPELSQIGEKLTPATIERVLRGEARSRPWMELKMPRFAPQQIAGLAAQLVAADGLDPAAVPPKSGKPSSEQVDIGKLLVGRTGFNCVSCHDIRGVKSTGVRGPDLAEVTSRVTRDWFDRWLLDPQRLSPGTRMPTVFFGGKSAAPQYLDGLPQAQIDALWAYLAQGQKLDLPLLGPAAGVLVAGGENPRFKPADRPILTRGFMPGQAGLRGIALGFPEGVHFAFDSDRCALARAWQGEFTEIGGWFDAGRGTPEANANRILGTVAWRGPEGPAFGIRSATGDVRALQPRYDGAWAHKGDAGFAYRLSEGQQVVCRVEERLRPIAGLAAAAFVRSLTFRDSQAPGTIVVAAAERGSKTVSVHGPNHAERWLCSSTRPAWTACAFAGEGQRGTEIRLDPWIGWTVELPPPGAAATLEVLVVLKEFTSEESLATLEQEWARLRAATKKGSPK